jgi:uncharacterized membrane protein YphA (DoxX/SURF4 family)
MKEFFVKLFFFLLCSALGFVFLYSGYSKIEPIEPFEFTFVDLGLAGWKVAPFMARFMIGLEFFIGFLLILGLFIKRFTIKLTLISLIIFSLYLVFILLKEGNKGNCGCFGNAIVMSPAEALVKNAIMFAVAIVILKFYDGLNYGKFGKPIMGIVFVGSFALPHILNYVDLDYSQVYLNKSENHFKLELDSLYKDAKLNVPPRSLSQGKHIIAFMSATCPHCRIAAKKLRLFKEKNESLPIYIVLNGDDAKFKLFFEDTKATNIPYCKLNGRNFVYLAGLQMPMIYLVNNSIVETNVNYMQLDQGEIEKWLEKP